MKAGRLDSDKFRPIMGNAMTTKTQRITKAVRHEDLLAADLRADPDFAEEWGRLGLAREVAAELIRYRSQNQLSQRALAKLLGVSQPRVVELESGEKNPQFETLAHIVAVTGIEFALDFTKNGLEPKLVGKAITSGPSHQFGGTSVLVASSTSSPTR
jgi:DNA-binding XRE family transcriptional regulator